MGTADCRLHGGSFYFGSASAPGLDGSTLAVKGNMIVVLVQYR
jgi:carboxylesterase type B